MGSRLAAWISSNFATAAYSETTNSLSVAYDGNRLILNDLAQQQFPSVVDYPTSRRRRLRARRKPAPLLLEARPGLPALLAAPGGAQGQALLLRAPPAGRSERPCRAPGRRLLRTAEAAGTEQRAASAATVQRDRAAPGRASLSSSALPGAPVHYADPPNIFPGRSINYYGTRGGHNLVFHTELQDALFASGLPFLVSVNVPEARELYSGADSITSLCSGKNSSKPKLLVMHRSNPVASTEMGEQSCCHSRIDNGNPVATAGLTRAILLPQQNWVEQSCCHRIGWNNPVATAGLTRCCHSRIDGRACKW